MTEAAELHGSEGAGMSDQKFAIEFDRDAIEEFCRKWRIKEFALFGSVLTAEFRPDSDVDVLITFEDPNRDLGPWGGDWETMRNELHVLFRRKVDLVEKKLVRNPFRRHHILTTRRVVYAA